VQKHAHRTSTCSSSSTALFTAGQPSRMRSPQAEPASFEAGKFGANRETKGDAWFCSFPKNLLTFMCNMVKSEAYILFNWFALSTPCLKKTVHFCFCQNFVKFLWIL